jgi:glycosyltransferase involved in cell wall biosynthesis
VRHRIRWAQWRVLAPLLRRAAHLICVADFEQRMFQDALRLPPERFTVIPNGGVLPELAVEPVDQCPNVIISVGRLERYKGQRRLIEALPIVHQHVPDARLLLVGAGPDEDALRASAMRLGVAEQVQVTSLPPSDREAMARVLGGARVFALLSDYEAHPLAVMEAVALGRPAVVTRTSGLEELVRKGLAIGVAVDASTAEVAMALVQQLRHPQPPQVPLATYTWDESAAALEQVYDHVLGRANTQRRQASL